MTWQMKSLLVMVSMGLASCKTQLDAGHGLSGLSRRFLQVDAPLVGIAFPEEPIIPDGGFDDIIAAVEQDVQVTVLETPVIGEVVCETLAEADEAPFLRFEIGFGEIITAQLSSFSVTDGLFFSDGLDRKVWLGDVVDPVPLEEGALASSVSMTYTEGCVVEAFIFSLTTVFDDGSTVVSRSIPYVDTLVYFVRTGIEFLPEGDPTGIVINNEAQPTDDSGGRRLRGVEHQWESEELSVMFLYTPEAVAQLGGSSGGMESFLVEGVVRSNAVMAKYEGGMRLSIAYVGPVPENLRDGMQDAIAAGTFHADVATLSDNHDAVVLLVGGSSSHCKHEVAFNDGSNVPLIAMPANCMHRPVHSN